MGKEQAQVDEQLSEVIPANVGLLEYLSTKNGNGLANKLLETFGNAQIAAAAAAQQQHARQLEFEHKSWKWGMAAQVAIFALAIGTVAFLSWKGKVDPVVGTLIGTIVGYALGRRQ
jgi:hypothetical protein